VSLNESAQFYSFENKKNGVDLKINYKDIPDSWARRIEKIDININYQADYNLIKKSLIKMGYADDNKIISDEIQAILSTGLYSSFDTKGIRKYTGAFSDNFLSFRNTNI
jgi:hypothetical protein